MLATSVSEKPRAESNAAEVGRAGSTPHGSCWRNAAIEMRPVINRERSGLARRSGIPRSTASSHTPASGRAGWGSTSKPPRSSARSSVMMGVRAFDS